MDKQNAGPDTQQVEVIKLNNTFVTDRAYTRRDENIVIPGIATVIEKLLDDQVGQSAPTMQEPVRDTPLPDAPFGRAAGSSLEPAGFNPARPPAQNRLADNIHIIAYPETNSLLVKG
ncbi:MAG: EscC/YscC/HrcC family type secretion system outer rane ring protein, partial [Actinomycetia bacterium]|nr:EscC/YscC/HrcC family type secretion system outer rane ring protein [Actinomycetes bacterium]